MTTNLSRGSEWHRWDPHLHTPGTAINDQFHCTWDEFVSSVNAAVPVAEALGITDYFSIHNYVEVRKRWVAGELANVKLVFPNVELRLTLQTETIQGLNVHLLFSPNELDHVSRIEEAISRLQFSFQSQPYSCSRAGLIRLGRAFDKTVTTDEGAYRTGVGQFKVDFDQLVEWYRKDDWLKQNCLVAVSAGKDGTSGLKKDGSFTARRQEIERFAHIVFSSLESDRKFWLGRKSGHDISVMRERYGGLKPCIHGCDAHDIAKLLNPDSERRCWLKSDVTFDALREAMIEPEERVWIGPESPQGSEPTQRIRSCQLTNASWFESRAIELNAGLVAIIGPRGSGKTALADMIAYATDAFDEDNDASFISKANPHLAGVAVSIVWENGSSDTRQFGGALAPDHFSTPRVRYLSQQFVERLCGHAGIDDALIHEIEDVVFDAIDPTDRLGAENFQDLRALRTEPIDHQVDELRQVIRSASAEIANEDRLRAELKPKQAKLEELKRQILVGQKALTKLVVKGKEQKQKILTATIETVQKAEAVLADLKLRKQKLDELEREVRMARQRYASEWEKLKTAYSKCNFTDTQWRMFQLRFDDDVDGTIATAKVTVAQDIRRLEVGPLPNEPVLTGGQKPLLQLRAERKKLEDELGIDATRERQYATAQQRLTGQIRDRDKLVAEIAHIEKSNERRRIAFDNRQKAYEDIFAELERERAVLEELYAPLHEQLKDSPGPSIGKLEFYVHRRVDVNDWARHGENLIDLRKKGPFQGRGALAEAAKRLVGEAWAHGDSNQVALGLRALYDEGQFGAIKDSLAVDITTEMFADWLFGTDHIHIEYGIRYDGVEIDQLSPGTRGIVLLIVYLALDQWDDRPLIIDQPEENLDPKSVFDELVYYFRLARRRRQVIVVTHNANLVVNTDADQVIIAASTRVPTSTLPHISYESGGLEDPAIRHQVCQVLEGGEDAFRQRDRKYRLSQ